MSHYWETKYFGSYFVTMILALINKEFIVQKHATAKIATDQYSFYKRGTLEVLTGAVECYS